MLNNLEIMKSNFATVEGDWYASFQQNIVRSGVNENNRQFLYFVWIEFVIFVELKYPIFKTKHLSMLKQNEF